jgi:hypothetical protein
MAHTALAALPDTAALLQLRRALDAARGELHAPLLLASEVASVTARYSLHSSSNAALCDAL